MEMAHAMGVKMSPASWFKAVDRRLLSPTARRRVTCAPCGRGISFRGRVPGDSRSSHHEQVSHDQVV